MVADPQNVQDLVTIDVQLGSQDWQLRTKMTVPSGPTKLRQMLPLLQTSILTIGFGGVH